MTTFHRYRSGTDPDDGYLASPELAAAVNAALAIGRPLLVSGEPGTGKTSLAASIAMQLKLGEVLRFDTHSDSRWQDCLYSFDALARLYDAQAEQSNAKKPETYRRFSALGRALTGLTGDETVEQRRAIENSPRAQRVVLIDEIDKAPRDFSNRLLAAIDGDYTFHIGETGESFRLPADAPRPVIVFTTNEERSLPDAFLRRCVFCHIKPPDAEQLRTIVALRLRQETQPDAFQALVERAIEKFVQLRAIYGAQLEKQPATAELLDWVRVLLAAGLKPDAVGLGRPFETTLLKTQNDLKLLLGDTEREPSRDAPASKRLESRNDSRRRP